MARAAGVLSCSALGRGFGWRQCREPSSVTSAGLVGRDETREASLFGR